MNYNQQPHHPRYIQQVRGVGLEIQLLVAFVVGYFVWFLPNTQYPVIVWITLVPVMLALWLGPLSLISGRKKSITWYNPTVLFNTALLYYTLKGATLASGDYPSYLLGFSGQTIIDNYTVIAIMVTAGILAFNAGFRYFQSNARRYVFPRFPLSRPSSFSILRLDFGALVLSVIGIISFIMLFYELGASPFLFIINPLQRSYLTDNTIGVASSTANLWRLGVGLFPLASLIMVITTRGKNRSLSFLFWIHVFIGTVLLLLTGGRTEVLAFALSLGFFYHRYIKKLTRRTWLTAAAIGILYSYLINVWRIVTGTGSFLRLKDLTDLITLQGLHRFLESTDLSDIRVFVLIFDTYGRSLPLKYGDTFLRILSQFVPRSFWPNKPLDLGLEIANIYQQGSMAGTPPGFFAELYMNFGGLGVIFGSALLGIGLASIYRRWTHPMSSPLLIIFYAILIPRIFVLPSATFANMVNACFFQMIAMVIVFTVSTVVNPHSGKSILLPQNKR